MRQYQNLLIKSRKWFGRHRSSSKAAQATAFTLERLEARVLLSADLAAVQPVPEKPVEAPVQVAQVIQSASFTEPTSPAAHMQAGETPGVTEFSSGFETWSFTVPTWHKFQYMGDIRNLVEQSNNAHSGAYGLRSDTVGSVDQQKASIGRELLWFPEGSHFYASFYLAIAPGTSVADLYVFDLESSKTEGQQGMRLGFNSSQSLYVNSKILAGPHANALGVHAFPRNQWVHVKVHYSLSSGPDGLTEVWQDGVQVVNSYGQTIAKGATYDWIEVGQTGNVSMYGQTLLVDDLQISTQPL